LNNASAKLSEFKRTHSGSLPEQQNVFVSRLTTLQVQLQGQQDAIYRLQQNRMLLESSLSAAETSEAYIVRTLEDKNSQLDALAGQADQKIIAVMEQELERLSLRYTKDHPEIQRLQAELAQKKQQEAAEADRRKKTARQVEPTKELITERERIGSLRRQLASVDRELEIRAKEYERSAKLLTSYQANVEQMPLVEQQMAGLERDFEFTKLNHKSLLEKKSVADLGTEVERNQQGEGFTIVDPAIFPTKPAKPNRPLYYGAGVILSILLGLALVLAIEIPRNVILGEWELSNHVVVIARVPAISPTGRAA
jgi:polysaccharide biosynthesis transport protein